VLTPLQLQPVSDPADPRLQPFLALPLRKAVGASPDDWFIGEGRLVVERLLTSPFVPAALLVCASKQRWVETVCAAAVAARALPAPLPVYLLPDERMQDVVGFDFHSGILGAGRRQTPAAWTAEISRWFNPAPNRVGGGATDTLLVLPALNSAENLGSIVRSACGLGARGVVLAAQSADPLSRRVIRVSMGHTLSLPWWSSPDWRWDLVRLREAGFRLVGIEHHPRMIPLHQAPRYPRQALVMGNEFSGLDKATLEMMDDIVGIPMHPAVDSLNVAVTAAIALHHYSLARH